MCLPQKFSTFTVLGLEFVIGFLKADEIKNMFRYKTVGGKGCREYICFESNTFFYELHD